MRYHTRKELPLAFSSTGEVRDAVETSKLYDVDADWDSSGGPRVRSIVRR